MLKETLLHDVEAKHSWRKYNARPSTGMLDKQMYIAKINIIKIEDMF